MANATDVTGPGVLAREQLVDRRGRRGAVADREDEAARDRVRVGRDHAVGRPCSRPPAGPARSSTATRSPRPPGWDAAPAWTSRPRCVEHADGAEARLHGLAEAQHDLARARARARAALGRGALEQGVGARARAARAPARAARRDERRPRASPRLRRSAPAAARRRRTTKTPMQSAIRTPAKAKIAPSGRLVLGRRRPQQVAVDRPLAPVDHERHPPVEDLLALRRDRRPAPAAPCPSSACGGRATRSARSSRAPSRRGGALGRRPRGSARPRSGRRLR